MSVLQKYYWHFFNTSHLWNKKKRNQPTQYFICCEEKSLILIFVCYPYQILFQIFSLLSYIWKFFIWSFTEKYLEVSCFQRNEMPAAFLDAFKMLWSYWKNRRTTKTNKWLLCGMDFYLTVHSKSSKDQEPLWSCFCLFRKKLSPSSRPCYITGQQDRRTVSWNDTLKFCKILLCYNGKFSSVAASSSSLEER